MAVTCWSYMALRKLISLNRNASNFPWAIILCPQQNKRVIFLKMTELKSLIKAIVSCTFDCGNCSFHKHLSCLFCVWGVQGSGKRREKGGKKQLWKDWSCFKQFCKSTNPSCTQMFVFSGQLSVGGFRSKLTLVKAISHTSPLPVYRWDCLTFW